MKTVILSALLLAAAVTAAVFAPYANVSAVGTPTENYTMPDPTSDPTRDEIKPLVPFSLQGPTAQSKAIPPYFITDFQGPIQQDELTVVGDGKWYLDIDINSPGFLYIYEYYPPDNNPSGHWLAYKWQLRQGGVWRLGPFNAVDKEPEGQRVYRTWFYSNGQWASVDARYSLIYWDYLKNLPELKIHYFTASPMEITEGDKVTLSWSVQGARSIEISMAGPISGTIGSTVVTPGSTTGYKLLATGLDGRQLQSGTVTVMVTTAGPAAPPGPPSPPTPTLPAIQPSFLDELGKFATNPLGLPATMVSLTILAVLIFLVIRTYSKRLMAGEKAAPEEIPFIPTTGQEEIPPISDRQAEEVRARLLLPGGLDIRLVGGGKVIGRADLARSLDLDTLTLISQNQFQVTYNDGHYFIEDGESTNGTVLNGIDIRGKGVFILKDSDIIEPAGAVQLKFSVSEA